MAKLHGKAKAEFSARMAKGRKTGHHGHKKKAKHRRAPSLHGTRQPKFTAAGSYFGHKHASAQGHAIKSMADKAAADMKRLAEQCKLDVKRAVAAAKKIKAKKPKKARKKKAKKHGHKKAHHKKHHKVAHHAKAPKHHKKTHHHVAKHRHAVHRAKKARHGKHHEKHVTASQVLGMRPKKARKKISMKRWTCEAPVRTGCGGGAKGGHVLNRVR